MLPALLCLGSYIHMRWFSLQYPSGALSLTRRTPSKVISPALGSLSCSSTGFSTLCSTARVGWQIKGTRCPRERVQGKFKRWKKL